MFPLMNDHLEYLDDEIKETEVFKPQYVDQILISKDSVFSEMCKVANVDDFVDLRAEKLNIRGITKEKLCDWLETVVCLLNSYCVPVLESAVELPDNLNKLKDEKITDQKSIIKLQAKLIEKKDGELDTVKNVVQSEIKSYSSVVMDTCNRALAPKKMKVAMKKVSEDEDRSKNLIIYGLKEDDDETPETKVSEVLNHLNEKPKISNCCRVGKESIGKVRPVKFTLSSSDLVRQILRKTKLLKEVEGCKTIYIYPDRSVEDRLAYNKLTEELKLKRANNNDPNIVYVIKNYKIVSFSKND